MYNIRTHIQIGAAKLNGSVNRPRLLLALSELSIMADEAALQVVEVALRCRGTDRVVSVLGSSFLSVH